MTAIGAVVAFDQGAIPRLRALQTRLAQVVKGCDRSQAWLTPGVGLAICQQFTLPEDTCDRDPQLIDEIALVSDIRLDNRAELAEALALDSATVRTLADGALLRLAWRRWGTRCVERLIGDFAFVIWSVADRVLFAARDPLGARPLFYAQVPGAILFASVPSVLAGLPGVSSALDPIRVAQRLAAIPEEPDRTYFQGISRVPSGHTVHVAGERIEVSRYWRWAEAPIRYAHPDDYVERFQELFATAVRARLRSSIPVVSLLSSGLDSNAVTATAAHLRGASSEPLSALTWQPRCEHVPVLLRQQLTDEAPDAARLRTVFPQIAHVIAQAPEVCLLEPLRAFSDVAGEPMRGVLNAPYALGTSLALRGRGRYAVLTGGLGNFTVSYDGPPSYSGWLLQMLRHIRFGGRSGGAISAEFAREHTGHLRAAWPTRDSVVARRRLIAWADLGATNAAVNGVFGLEFRDPTADVRVVDFCLSIPDAEFRRGRERRLLIRRAMHGRVPDATLRSTVRGVQAADWPRFIVPYRATFVDLLANIERSPLAARAIDVTNMRRLLTRVVDDWQAVPMRHATVLGRAVSVGDFILNYEGKGS